MKTNKFSAKVILGFIAVFMSASLLVAAIIDSDTFSSNTEGWTGTGVSWDSSNKRLLIKRSYTATKIFDLGIANAGASVKISLKATKTTNWESADKIVITSNSTSVYNSNAGGTIGFNAIADASGKITLAIKANSDKSGEDLYIDDINIDDEPSVREKEFARKATFNMQGNMKTIGNTVLCPKNSSGQCIEATVGNANINLKYVDIDGVAGTFNSSSATLVDSAITTAGTPKVKWAGLYWSGYVHDYTKINDSIKFTENGITHDIAPDEKLGHSKFGSFNRYNYGNYADVTTLMQDKDPTGTYTAHNIPCEEGETNNDGDGLGNSGAWTLVVIYENNSIGEKIRNMTVFDGFKVITDQAPKNKVDIPVDGFKTPKSGNVDSTLSIFANEGDKYITGDYFELKNQTGTVSKKLPNTGNFFDSSITGVDTRNPIVNNNNGIDIHTNQVGIGSAGSQNIIGLDQTSATITLGSTGDYYFPVMVAFATELQVTELCYDYSVRINDQAMQKGTSNRQYNAGVFTSGSIDSKIFIRSLEGDFDFDNTTLRASWSKIPKDASDTSTPTFTFDNSKSAIQPSNQYQWLPSTQRSKVPTDGAIAIGGINYDDEGGGVLLRNQSTYASINHQATDISTSDTLQLDIDVNFDIYFDSAVPTNYTVGTQAGSLKLCPGTPVYSPEWLEFNIERFGAIQGEYGLDTEVTGRNFNAQIAAYDPTNPNVRKAVPVDVSLEVELIELPTFDSFTAYSATNTYDRICQDSSIFKPWLNSAGTDTEKRFTLFNAGDITKPFPVNATQNRFALRNSALRVWALETGPISARVLKTNTCTNLEGSCFRDLYANDTDYQNEAKCTVECAAGEKECYTCLKRYYGKPFCSRDNFSIRPDAIRLEVSDLNPSTRTLDVNDATMKTSTVKPMTLVANHPNYGVGLQARKLNSPKIATEDSNENALGYYIYDTQNTEVAYETILPADRFKPNRFFGFLFDIATGTQCADTTHSNLKYNIVNGASKFTWQLKKANVGKYNLFLVDNDWTIVDQARYDYKTVLGTAPKTDDCIPFSTDSPDSGKPGCTVSSEKQNKDSDNDFKLMPISFAPDSFDLSSIARGNANGTSKNWEYMSNLANDGDAAIKFSGSIVANAAKDSNGNVVRASNFTTGCAATDVKIYMDYDTTSTTAIMKGALVGTDGNITPHDADKTIATALTITKDRFVDSDVGAANIDMRYNIAKLYNAAMNPVKVEFKKMFAQATADRNITKDGVDTYQPTGEKTLGEKIAYIYGRVYTNFMDAIKSVTAATTNMTLSVLGYCVNDANTNCNEYSKAPFDAFESTNPTDPTSGTSKSTIANWFKMITHDANNGQINSITMNDTLAKIDSVNPVGITQFTSGSTAEMTLSFPMSSRDKLVEYTVIPSPWLLYSPVVADGGTPKYIIDWISPKAIWTGKGQTGNVVNMNANPDSKRLSW